jgi:hypothetical protein
VIRAVLVGVDLPHDWPPEHDLGAAAKSDVLALQRLLRSQYHADEVIPLVDRDARKEVVLNHIHERLTKPSAPGDVVVFYFGGHGIKRGATDVCFAAFDTAWFTKSNRKNPLMTGTVITIDDLKFAFRDLKPGVHIEAIFDTCFSGRLAFGWARLARTPSALASLARQPGLVGGLLRLLGVRPKDAVAAAFRGVGVKNPYTLRSQIEQVLEGRHYTLWLSSSPEADSHQQPDEEGRLRGAFTLALESALQRGSAEHTKRATTFREVRRTLVGAKQSPRLIASEKVLPQCPIFKFGFQI